jgi:hypothetical protein
MGQQGSSTVKSTCPGVSMMLMCVSPHWQYVAALCHRTEHNSQQSQFVCVCVLGRRQLWTLCPFTGPHENMRETPVRVRVRMWPTWIVIPFSLSSSIESILAPTPSFPRTCRSAAVVHSLAPSHGHETVPT